MHNKQCYTYVYHIGLLMWESECVAYAFSLSLYFSFFVKFNLVERKGMDECLQTIQTVLKRQKREESKETRPKPNQTTWQIKWRNSSMQNKKSKRILVEKRREEFRWTNKRLLIATKKRKRTCCNGASYSSHLKIITTNQLCI